MVIGCSIQLPPEVLTLYPFKSHYLTINDMAYHYVDEGRGDPVICLHGNPTWSFFYRDVIKALSPHYRVLAPDHIGCGLSAKPSTAQYHYRLKNRVADLDGFIDRLNIGDRITLILHDWGGMIGFAWAVKAVERVKRIIILNTAAFLPPQGKSIPWRLRLVRNMGAVSAGLVLGLNLFARAAVYMAPYTSMPANVRSGYLAPYNRPIHRIATLKFVEDIPLTESDHSYPQVVEVQRRLERLASIPMLICWGARDFVFDHDYLAEWQRRFPRAASYLYDHAGHYLLEDAAEQIIPQIQSFLQTHPL